MSDVFISYARSTATQAQAAAQALRSLGYSVWLDDELPAHRAYTHVIEEQLAAAKAALVIWSAEAVKSEWVLSEANRAREEGKLVQVAIDSARLPMPFDQIQCAKLADWTGDVGAPGWRKIVASIADLTGGAARNLAAALKSAEPLLAVLAFDNLSGDADMAYFSDGVSDEIQQTVSRATDLKVIARSSSFQFRGADKAVRRVAAELKATHLLDGSVRRSGTRVRISTQLIECASEVTLWSDRFDRDLSDIFALQDEIAAAVAAALKIAFAPRAAPQTVDPAAYDLYLHARDLFPKDGGSKESIGLLERAVALAPRFARAWAALAIGRVALLRFGQSDLPYAVLRAAVVDAAETALGLDPNSGGAYLALSYLVPPGRWLEREAPLKQALSVAPNDPEILTYMAFFCSSVGRMDEALVYAKQAHDLDPLYPPAANWYASALDGLGRHAESLALWDAFLLRWPDVEAISANALFGAAVSQDWGRFNALETSLRDRGSDRSIVVRRILHYGRYMREPSPPILARDFAAIQERLAQSETVNLDGLAFLCTAGMMDETFGLIDRASFAYLADDQDRPPSWNYGGGTLFDEDFYNLFSVPFNTVMMRDIRFVGLCAKLGFCDYWVKTERWPDCVEDVAPYYDFKAEARRLAGSA
jgi:TolB-like protein